jgi:acyl carrier protein
MNSATGDSLRTIISGYFRVKPNRIVDDARFRDLGADWLDRLELFMVIEDQLPELQTDKLVVEQNRNDRRPYERLGRFDTAFKMPGTCRVTIRASSLR